MSDRLSFRRALVQEILRRHLKDRGSADGFPCWVYGGSLYAADCGNAGLGWMNLINRRRLLHLPEFLFKVVGIVLSGAHRILKESIHYSDSTNRDSLAVNDLPQRTTYI